MKSFPRLLSLLLALILMLSVFTVAPMSVSAAAGDSQSTAIDKEGDDITDLDLGDEDETTDDEDETTDDEDETTDGEDETQPVQNMAAPKSLFVENIDIYDELHSYDAHFTDGESIDHSWRCYDYDNKIRFTVTLEDDTVLTSDENGYVSYNGKDCRPDFDDGQSFDTPWGTGEHEVEFDFFGATTTAMVTVHESPVKSIDVKDITCKEGSNGFFATYYPDPEDPTKVTRYFCYDETPQYTVTLNDNTVIESDDGDFTLYGEDFRSEVNTQQFLDPWGVGDHPVKAVILGKEYSYKFTITESDIADVEVKNATVYEDIDADVRTAVVEGIEHQYNYYNYNPEITLALKDSTTATVHLNDEVFEYNGTKYPLTSYDAQDEGDEWGLGDHNVFIMAAGFIKEITVTVAYNPIKEINVNDVDVYKGLDSSSVYDEDAKEYWDEYNYSPSYSVKLKNGTTLNDTEGSVIIGDQTYSISVNDDQSFENQWEVGKSYKAQATIGLFTAAFNVNVLGNAIKSVELLNNNITVTKGVDEGEYYDEANDKTYQKLYYDKYVSLQITMFDDTKVTADSDGLYIFKGKEISVLFSDDQTADNIWETGAHTAAAMVGGFTINININVVDCPAKSVRIYDTQVYEGMNNDSFYEYNPYYVVELMDGTTLASDEDNSVYYNGQRYYLETTDDQEENPWSVGGHTVTGTVMGVSNTFVVQVLSCPVASVDAEPVEIYENSVGYWDLVSDPVTYEPIGEYFFYDARPTHFTITLKDGQTIESDEYGCVEYNGMSFQVENVVNTQSLDNQWVVGNTYESTARVLGFEFKFDSKIIGSPVKSAKFNELTLIEGCDVYPEYEGDGTVWQHYNCESSELSFKLTLKNGKTLTGEGGSVEYNDEFYEITSVIDDQSVDNQWKAGSSYEIKVSILGYEATVKVNIISNPVAKVTIKGDAEAVLNEDGYNYEQYENNLFVGTFFYYEVQPNDYTVTLKDGKTLTSDEEGYVVYKGRYFKLQMDTNFTVQDYYNQWELGNTYPAVGRFMGKPVNYNVKVVSVASTKLKLSSDTTKLYVGGSVTLDADVANPVGATKYKSSNTAVATVTSGGKVTAKKAGKVTITATNNGVSDSVSLTVSKRANTAKFSAPKKTVKYSTLKKKNQTVKAITVKKPQGKVTYAKAKGDKKISVNKKTGKITLKKGMKKKTYTIKVKIKVAGNTKYNPVTKTISVKIVVK